MGDIFPDIAYSAAAGCQHRKMPARFRNSQNTDETWPRIGRTPKLVEAIPSARGIDMATCKGVPMY